MTNRVAIFVDGRYLDRILKDDFNRARVDFRVLVSTMARGQDILRTYYYDCLPHQSDPPTQQERVRYAQARRFHDALRMLPRFEVRLGRLQRREDSQGRPFYQQKRVDILLGVDMVQLAAKGHIREAVLLAGDSDFVPAVTAAKSEGVIVSLFHGTACHGDLVREVDERRRFDQALIDSVARN